MTERELFMEALDRASPADRAAYLDAACGGDPALRERVEALLRSHEGAGKFLAGSAPERLAGAPFGPTGDDTRTGPSAPDGDLPLDFLEPSDKPGSVGRLGHYEVQQVVGRGGMGVVLKAFDESLHRVVAIKVMAPQLASGSAARKRFVREARAQAAVTHDHVVTTHAVQDAGPLPHIVMQFVAGQSLQDRLDRTGPLQLPEILRIGTQTASGLAAAHAQGLVHRDVKPANILLENGVERVKLTDFGLARAADDASLTQSGSVAGTPAFMSPEQAEGKAVDHRSDLFSLGSVLYAMCTGRPPFRASTSMGVLKRVCEETPRPIREANPEIPDWLVAVVEKLHAKDPAARFQSAAEVAELLGRQLAQVQHPSTVPVPTVAEPADAPPAAVRGSHRGHRWAVAAAVLVATLAVLGTTEATGVTNVRATVIRIFTPEGTLVVETDDPNVKVTIEGNGDLVITGAGVQEVRLPPGSYKVQATKDGKPVKLDRDLVTISRGGTQTVRVRVEDPPPAAAAPKAEAGAFVRLRHGVEVRTFDTLAEAVRGAGAGDTIEVRGNGPFVTGPIKLPAVALTIRAGEGYRPVIEAGPDAWDANAWIWAHGPLVLEGLEFRGGKIVPQKDGAHALRVDYDSPLSVAHCRLVFLLRRVSPIHTGRSTNCEIRHCEFVLGSSANSAVAWHAERNRRLTVDGCIVAGRGPNLLLGYRGAPTGPCSIEFTRNTVTGPHSIQLARYSDIAAQGQPLSLRVADNVFDCPTFMILRDWSDAPPLAPAAALAFVKQLVEYQEQRNTYSGGGRLLEYSGKGSTALSPDATVKDLEAWQRFWGQQATTSRTGSVHFEGGAAVAYANLHLNSREVTPADFRLRPDSAGYRAGKDGKDLGVDVDLVGPGAAYERWKKTPAYQQWLKNTGQMKK